MLTDTTVPQRSPRVSRNYAQLPRFQRVKISVLGRYMLANRSEFPCQVLEMSPGDAVVIAPVAGNPGEKVIAYLDHIGRVEGSIMDSIDGGFTMDVAASPRLRVLLVVLFSWLAFLVFLFLLVV